jgi:type III secretion system low calcium response chaperone LcrH/SycD
MLSDAPTHNSIADEDAAAAAAVIADAAAVQSGSPSQAGCAQLLALMAEGVALGEILQWTEGTFDAVYALGLQHYNAARYADASKVFSFLMLHKHTEPRYIKAHAACLQAQCDYLKALEFYALLQVMDPGDALTALRVCECLLGLGRNALAAKGLALVLRMCVEPQHDAVRSRAEQLMKSSLRSRGAAGKE